MTVIFVAVAIAAVLTSLVLFVLSVLQARSSKKTDAKLVEAIRKNHDALVNLDQAFAQHGLGG